VVARIFLPTRFLSARKNSARFLFNGFASTISVMSATFFTPMPSRISLIGVEIAMSLSVMRYFIFVKKPFGTKSTRRVYTTGRP
jgi:hypothetical protein